MRLYLINPANPLVAFIKANESHWNQYRVWKPLGLMVVAALTPRNWEVTIIDENLGIPDYSSMPRPDLVGITAFTSQATGAYKVAAKFRELGVPVVMGGIHASMCQEEALERVDAIVTGESESIWGQVLVDVENGRLQRLYAGTRLDMAMVPAKQLTGRPSATELRFDYQADVDLLFAWVGGPEPARNVEVAPGVYVRVTPAGNRVLGIEILDCASRFHVDPSTIDAAFAPLYEAVRGLGRQASGRAACPPS
jgi:radical SAM superfamily enzyme YgiQ (UPF0313 family)